MEIDWEALGRVIVGSIPVLAALLGLLRGPGVLRSRLRHDLELLQQMPEGTVARSHWEAHLGRQVLTITTLDREGKRDWSGAIIVFVLIAGLLALGTWIWTLGAWWSYALSVTIGLFAAAGISSMVESLELVPRDEKGKPLVQSSL